MDTQHRKIFFAESTFGSDRIKRSQLRDLKILNMFKKKTILGLNVGTSILKMPIFSSFIPTSVVQSLEQRQLECPNEII